MIHIKVKIHDKFSFEFKISYITNQDSIDETENEFSINTWLFMPNSLDINRTTYTKDQFYKDTKSNVRLITPVFTLKEIYTKENNPISQVKDAISVMLASREPDPILAENYAYHIRLLASIFKSASRDNAYYIIEETDDQRIPYLVKDFITHIRAILFHYRKLWGMIDNENVSDEIRESFRFGDDFIGNMVEQQTFRIMKGIEHRRIYKKVKPELYELLNEEDQYKEDHNYLTLNVDDPSENYLVVMRRGILKKFIESDLYLNTKNTKDGAFVEQFYYGLAAGISMIFATVVAFTAQLRYGNFTGPLFIALVISYIFKDRIKDLMRYYFSNQLGKKYFDTKRQLEIRNDKIGWTKEAFDFVNESKIPDEVLSLRKRTPLVEAENRIYNEKIILYRKLVKISGVRINKDRDYKFIGINDITRFNITSFIQKADNPFVSLYTADEKNGYNKFKGEKVYALHFIIRFQSRSDIHFRKFRLLFNRDGIKEINEIN